MWWSRNSKNNKMQTEGPNPHIKMIVNDYEVPEIYVDGRLVPVYDVRYHWHTGGPDINEQYEIEVVYYVGAEERTEKIEYIPGKNDAKS